VTTDHLEPTPRRSAAHEQRWPASLAVLVALGGQLAIPDQVALGPRWLLPALQVVLLLPLVATNPIRLRRDHPVLRILAVVSAVVVLLANAATLGHLVALLVQGLTIGSQQLLVAGLVLVTTNIIGTSVVLWELDRGGPFARAPSADRPPQAPDLLFPQMTLPGPPTTWIPAFVDYLFVGFTMSTAFSPTDTLPLSRRAKAVFMLGATVAITTFVIVAARAANIL
jgi:hypothetical protein